MGDGNTHYGDEESEFWCGGDGACPDWAEEPLCIAYDHDWQGVGGCRENPGVQSLGGTTIEITRRCRACGIVEVSRYVGSQRNPGECDRRSYAEGPPDIDADDSAQPGEPDAE